MCDLLSFGTSDATGRSVRGWRWRSWVCQVGVGLVPLVTIQVTFIVNELVNEVNIEYLNIWDLYLRNMVKDASTWDINSLTTR